MDYNNDDKSISKISVLVPDTDILTINSTGGINIPAGTTAQRPPLSNGLVRNNTTTGFVEISSNSKWVNIDDSGKLPVGGAASNILIKNSATDYDAYWGPITADMAPDARDLVAFVKNETATTITKGTPVYQVGNVGNSWTISVAPADAAVPSKLPAIGVLAQDLVSGATGDMIILGEIRDVNTSSFNESDEVYLAAGGGYTNVKPTDPNVAVQFLGIVTKIHTTNGGGYVTGTGTVDQFRGDTAYFEGWDGTSWHELANRIHQHPWSNITSTPTTLSGYGITDAVNKTGDSMTGSLSLPKTKGDGLLVNNQYAWVDIIGSLTPKTIGTNVAKLESYYNYISAWAHPVGSYGDIIYHIPHDYAPNTNIYIHVHWGHNGTDISGTFKVNLWATFAKRNGMYAVPIATSITVNALDITNTPQYFHRVDEIQFSMIGGSSSMLNTTDLEVDGLINVHYEIETIPSITGSTQANLPYLHTIDIHMQSTNVGTANKDPDFYS